MTPAPSDQAIRERVASREDVSRGLVTGGLQHEKAEVVANCDHLRRLKDSKVATLRSMELGHGS